MILVWLYLWMLFVNKNPIPITTPDRSDNPIHWLLHPHITTDYQPTVTEWRAAVRGDGQLVLTSADKLVELQFLYICDTLQFEWPGWSGSIKSNGSDCVLTLKWSDEAFLLHFRWQYFDSILSVQSSLDDTQFNSGSLLLRWAIPITSTHSV